MRRLLVLLVAVSGLAACNEMINSDQPLFSRGDGTLRPGLWAVLDTGCASPGTAAVQTWADCAMPIWVTDDTATVLMPKPTRGDFLLAAGDPRVVQVGFRDETGATGYSYAALRPEGAAPYVRASVWMNGCPEAIAGPQAEETCTATSAEQVRRGLAALVKESPAKHAVWIAAG